VLKELHELGTKRTAVALKKSHGLGKGPQVSLSDEEKITFGGQV